MDISNRIQYVAELNVRGAPNLPSKLEDFSEAFDGFLILSELVMGDSLSSR